MPTSALAAVIGLCATTIGIQIRFFSVLKTDMRSLNGRIINLGDHVERVEERLEERLGKRIDRVNDRIDRVEAQLEERLGNRIDRVEERLGQRIDLVNSRIDRVEENLGQRIDLVNGRIDRVEEGLGQRIELAREELNGRIELVSRDLTVVGRDVAHVKGQWDTMLTFLPYPKAESVTSLPS